MRHNASNPYPAILLLLLTGGLPGAAAQEAKQPAVDFARDIRPLLAAHCTKCHGPQKREGGLRLDGKLPALAGGDSGKVILPGKPDESPLLLRAGSEDDDLRMPPEGERLSAAEIALLRRWIREGAAWPDDADEVKRAPDHWSFQPVEHVELPAGPEPHPIDRLVRARLRREGLEPSPPAGRHTLLRRLSLDLTGLPPTAEEIEDFLGDNTPGAYERVVERLLASPHFGERWALPWLDLARYADSDGYEKDLPRPHAWRWRDWLIGAINRDLPFDQFTVQQLAGDLLPGATQQVQLATGFHRNTLTNREGGVDQEEFRVAAVVDRSNTTFSTWMGLTVGCAQCHSHKYDPITQREFYRLYAFFNDANEQDLNVEPTGEQLAEYEKQRAAHEKRLAELTAQLEAEQPALRKRLAAWEQKQRDRLAGLWTPLELVSQQTAGDTHTVVARTALARVTGLRLQLLPDEKAPRNDLQLAHVEVSAQPAAGGARGPLWLIRAEADTEQGRRAIGAVLDPQDPGGWTPGEVPADGRSAYFATAEAAGEAGWLGNPPADGSQDGATNLLNVYHGSPVRGAGTVGQLRVFTNARPNAAFAAYLLRPVGATHRVVYRQEFTADGTTGERVYDLAEPWQVRPGDVFAHSGNGGPTYAGGAGTKDAIYYPLKKLPGAGETVRLGDLPTIAARTYAMQVRFEPAPPPASFVKPRWGGGGATLTFTFRLRGGSLGKFALEASDRDDPLADGGGDLPAEIVAIVRKRPAERDAKEQTKLRDHFATIDSASKKLNAQIAAHRNKAPKKPTALAHVMQQGPPRQTHVHVRGNFLQKGVEVQPGTPAFLPPLVPRGQRPDRLDLARWIVSPQNPLTARVAVNHVWAALFGQGLVRTTEDFGTQGEPPSHPQLFDWLAAEFQRLGYRRKALIRRIVTSQTYRQQSRSRPDVKERDPENRLLARQNRFRLPAELVRDQYLAAAGLLDRRVGGPSFRPPLPDSVTRVQFVNNWKADSGEELYRRGMYIHLQRNLMLPMLMTFDRPEAILTCTRRERSNTPLQALTLLNGPTFVDAAEGLAAALAGDTSLDEAGRVRAAFLRTVARPPTGEEQQRVTRLLEELTGYYAAHADEAQQLTGGPFAARWQAAGVEKPTAAAWVAVCRTLLNLDEVITRE